MDIGVNADPHFGWDPRTIADLGVSWVRFPLWPDMDYNPFVEGCQACGISTLAVFDDQAISDHRGSESWTAFYARKAAENPGISRWQILNEPDGPSASESGPHDVGTVNAHLWAARRAMPTAYIVGPGLVSGSPDYARQLNLQHVDALAIHPYGQRPQPDSPAPDWGVGNVQDLVALYRPVIHRHKLEVIVSEFGAAGDMFDDEHQRAEYHSGMLIALAQLGVESALIYCFSDVMRAQDGGMGCYDASGDLKETGAAIIGATAAAAA